MLVKNACPLLVLSSMLWAVAADAGDWRLSPGAFGTFGAIYHDQPGVEFRRDLSQPSGASADQVDLDVDSLLGLQLNIGYGDQWEMVAQAIGRPDTNNSWQPQLSRLFLRYVPDASLMLRVGRLPVGLYPRVDSRDVAYSYLPIRPPLETNGFLSNDTLDGADLAWTHPYGEALWRLKLFGGTGSPELAASPADKQAAIDLTNVGVTLDLFEGGWQYRIGYGLVRLLDKLPANPLVEPLRASGDPQAADLADRFADPGDHYVYLTAALAYDQGPVQFEAQLQSVRHTGRFGQAFNNGHLVLGYQFGKLTPYLAAAFIDSTDDIQTSGLENNPDYTALAAAARAVQVQGGAVTDQHTLTLGLRYDFAQHFDLKFQIDRVAIDNSQLIIDKRTDPTANIDMTVFGLALDFAF